MAMEEKKVVGDGKKFCGKINEILWGEVRGLRGKVGWGRGQKLWEKMKLIQPFVAYEIIGDLKTMICEFSF